MNTSYNYFVINIQEGGKNYAYAQKIAASNNLLSIFLGVKGIKTVNACKTFTEAKKIAAFWNNCYKENKTYLFDSPIF